MYLKQTMKFMTFSCDDTKNNNQMKRVFLQSSYKLLEMSVYKKSHICILELLKKIFKSVERKY